MSRICSSTLVSLALVAASFAMTGDAEAQRKGRGKKTAAKAACKIKFLPFVTGYSWGYQYVIPPGVEERAGGIKAKVPETLTITVKSVAPTSEGTAITLTESYRKVSTETVLTCDSKGLNVPLNSFYFAGELPGTLGITTDALAAKGEIYPSAAGLSRGASMYVEIKADVIRNSAPDTTAKHPLAKLEIERQITVGGSEEVEVEHGIHKATAVEVALSGRTALVTDLEKKVSLPEGTAMLWFSNGIGLVRAYNRLGQGWELQTFKDAAGADVE
jgi:hypothetical protein